MSWRDTVLALATAALMHAGQAAAAPRALSEHEAPVRCAVVSFDPSFARAIDAERPTRHIVRSIAIDLDRDGDLDVVASTLEEPVVVWLRDDEGRFTRQQPSPATGLTSASTVTARPGGATTSALKSPNRDAARDSRRGFVVPDRSARVSHGFFVYAAARAPGSCGLRGPPSGHPA